MLGLLGRAAGAVLAAAPDQRFGKLLELIQILQQT